MGLGKLHVETRARPLPGRRRIARRAFSFRELLRHRFASLGAGEGNEFLEARIIPERIEHGVEPEQRWSEVAQFPLVSAAKS